MNASVREPHRWNWPFLILSQVLGGALLGSWFFDPTRRLWDALDRMVFRFTDQSLSWGEPWRVFWAALNSKAFDMASAAFFLVIFLVFVVRSRRADVARHLGAGVIIALYTSLVIGLSSHYIFTFERLSPTWVVEGARRLSELVAWIPHKDWSGKSFPGDHGIAAMMFTCLLWRVAGRRFGLISMCVSVFFVLPRLFSGAHWLSDVLAGSLSVTVITLGLLLATPLWGLGVAIAAMPIATVLRAVGWTERPREAPAGEG